MDVATICFPVKGEKYAEVTDRLRLTVPSFDFIFLIFLKSHNATVLQNTNHTRGFNHL